MLEGAVVGTGLVGLAVFARSIRLFTQFQHGREIPEEFIRKGVRLRGKVSTVEEDGTMRILHQPLLRLPRLLSRQPVAGRLSVSLAGVEVSGAGASFLRTNLGSEFAGDGKTVWFSLIHRPPPAKGRDLLQAEVTAKLGRMPLWSYNLNQELVRRGLARVPSTDVPGHLALLRASPVYSRLVNQLLISERIADRRGVGMWQRDTWVEGMQALPSQISTMTTNSSPYRLLILLGLATKSALITTGRVGLWSLKTGAKVGSMAVSGSKTAAREGAHVYKATVATSRGVCHSLSPFIQALVRFFAAIRARLQKSS